MTLFGRDCGCDERREYMQANPVGFVVLVALIAAAAVLVLWKGVPGAARTGN